MPIQRILAAGLIAGVVSNLTGYLITGRLFHRYQAKTPGTWRTTEDWTDYLYAASIRILACVAIAVLCAAVGTWTPAAGFDPIARAGGFGAILWAASILPVVSEVALFVNWHRGFVIGLLLDWLVVCLLSSVSAAAVAAIGVNP